MLETDFYSNHSKIRQQRNQDGRPVLRKSGSQAYFSAFLPFSFLPFHKKMRRVDGHKYVAV